MKKIKRISQRCNTDCGVACVAMLARVTYEKAFDARCYPEGTTRFSTSHWDVVNALNYLGHEIKWKKFVSWEDVSGEAAVSVSFRKHQHNTHWVVFDGVHILDPHPHRTKPVKCSGRYRVSGWYLLMANKATC